MIQLFGRRRRRFVPPLVSLVIAAAIFACSGRVDMDPLDQTSRRRGSGIYIGGIRIGGFGEKDRDTSVVGTPVSNPFVETTKSDESQVIGNWPPKVAGFYPDLILTDQNDDRCQLSDFAGKVILIELAAVPCAGCQAFAGGNQRGAFRGGTVQKGLDSIHQYARQIAHVELGGNPDVVFVQLLIYGSSMSNPTTDEVKGWAKHFGMDRSKNQIVLRGDPSMISRETYNMIPGFHLIDRNFVLQYDSSGHQPKDDLYQDLLPALGEMTNQR